MNTRAIDANALIEKIKFREGTAMGQREIFLVEGEPTLTLNTLRDEIFKDAVDATRFPIRSIFCNIMLLV